MIALFVYWNEKKKFEEKSVLYEDALYMASVIRYQAHMISYFVIGYTIV